MRHRTELRNFLRDDIIAWRFFKRFKVSCGWTFISYFFVCCALQAAFFRDDNETFFGGVGNFLIFAST
jgi:hypothetical protein